MKKNKLIISVFVLLGFGLSNLQAQETIPATGDDASGIGGSASYTIGQVVYTTSTGTNGSVAQGVQQPYEISVVSGIEQAGINLECVVYPNPVTDYLILSTVETHGRASEILIYQLFNIEGRMISTNKILSEHTKIEMNNLTQGNYILRIIEKDKVIKSFKIIKY